MTKEAEEYFLSKYGNKITASESWVIRFATDFSSEQNKELIEKVDLLIIKNERFKKELKIVYSQLSEAKKALERIHFNDFVDTVSKSIAKEVLQQLTTNT